jgi:DNA-binding transcriptional regulator YiaG
MWKIAVENVCFRIGYTEIGRLAPAGRQALTPQRWRLQRKPGDRAKGGAMKPGTKRETPHTIIALLSHGALPPREGATTDHQHWLEYQRQVFRRLGFKGTLEPAERLKAAKSVGFTFEEFGELTDAELCRVLEAKAAALERIRRPSHISPMFKLTDEERNRSIAAVREHNREALKMLKDEVRTAGGRPTGVAPNGKTIKRLRKETRLSQENFAADYKMHKNTLSHAERGDSVSDDLLELIAEGLSKELDRRITVDELKMHQIPQKL